MLGVRSVIDLQEHARRGEKKWVRALGMQYFNIPLSSKRPATAAETQYFLKLVNDSENWPVYVHCAGGRHRTGEMTAVYRITHDSWTADKAYEEMRRFRYYSHGGHGSLRDYVYQFYGMFQVDLIKAAVAPAPLLAPIK
jgi:protein tyrosine/serine phosphatase